MYRPDKLRDSPIVWIGGKKKAFEKIVQYFPVGLTEMVSPFAGGAGIEINMAEAGIRVHAYDADIRLVNFFQQLQKDPDKLIETIRENWTILDNGKWTISEETRYLFKEREQAGQLNDFELAVGFWLWNRCIGLGLMSREKGHYERSYVVGGKVEDNIKQGLPDNFTIQQMDFETVLRSHIDEFMYIDPPYVSHQESNMATYGYKGWLSKDFDHLLLRDMLTHRMNWVMSLDDVPATRELYEGHRMAKPSWFYHSSNVHGHGRETEDTDKELLIFSRDLNPDEILKTKGPL
jgi:DNA adenine methylase